ncbi:bifunctional metallophosphatase/5'-nucleotidase [Haliea sp. E1-2-M8]|uniref:bifunctional metallophosphatase/5'-nucleotidase n=1 Tax=Haliea sp. E1-2-M8 TaxID=3064706 RepID=UPI002721C81F|nr:bifunctional metallophosphatase/5'-nucleotidase [Haliea sp. E1-2-M8]MDO8863128.1 bifunctional metallophosphatase/5'-nucleotidase [Haliea sp. E1-2-M8]
MSERRLTILQVNDLHGYLEPHPEVFRGRGKFNYRTCGGLARIASIFKQVRAEQTGEVLALDNGDTFHGTFVAVQSRGEALLPLMNALEFDAMTLHWEFAYGPAQVHKLAAGLNHPPLAINIFDKVSDHLVFDPSRVIERGGLRIGIIGIASNIVDKSMPPSYSEGVCFTLGNTELPAHIERLRSVDRVDLVVVLSHLGFAQDAKLAAEVAGIDVLISGHTHNRLYRPVWVGNTPIIQSGCHGSFVGRLDLTVNGGKIIDVRHEMICVDEQIEPDADMASRVEEVVAPHRAFLGQVVGRLHSPLDRATSLEATMDNVLLDAIAAAAGTRLAFSNGWRYGAPILPGEVTMEHLWNIVPTQPPISTVELTGDELRAMLEANLERTYSPDPYCQMGGFVKRCRGLNMYFKMENPKGHRIEDLLIEGAPIQPGRSYRAAMLGEQGVPGKYGSKRQKLDIDAIESLQQLFERGRQVRGSRRGSVVAV